MFKTRAGKIQKYLAAEGCDARVEINKEKPGRGNFVVRVTGRDEPVLELLGMKRPFSDLKSLDMEDVGKDVIAAIRESKDRTKNEKKKESDKVRGAERECYEEN